MIEDTTNLRLEGIHLMTNIERALSFASLIGLVAGECRCGKIAIEHKATEEASTLLVFATFRCYQFDAGILTRVDRRLRVL